MAILIMDEILRDHLEPVASFEALLERRIYGWLVTAGDTQLPDDVCQRTLQDALWCYHKRDNIEMSGEYIPRLKEAIEILKKHGFISGWKWQDGNVRDIEIDEQAQKKLLCLYEDWRIRSLERIAVKTRQEYRRTGGVTTAMAYTRKIKEDLDDWLMEIQDAHAMEIMRSTRLEESLKRIQRLGYYRLPKMIEKASREAINLLRFQLGTYTDKSEKELKKILERSKRLRPKSHEN